MVGRLQGRMAPASPFADLASRRIDLLMPIDKRPARVRPIAVAVGLSFAVALACSLVIHLTAPSLTRLVNSEQAILWLSDVHLDARYIARSNTSTSCHAVDPNVPAAFTFGRYGCDTPPALFDSLIENLPKLIATPTLIVLGGDNIGGVIEYSMGDVVENFANILRKLQQIFPGVPILPVIGNNELSPNYGTWSNDSVNFAVLADAWASLLSASERSTLANGGYYFRDFDRLRVIVLNTVIYQVYRAEDTTPDPYGQFAWLDEVCASAQARGLGIFVFFHVPPSMSTRDRFQYQGWYQRYVDQFAQVYFRYRFAMTCGPLHLSAILPLFNGFDRRDGYIMSAPGLSLRHESNPGFRLIRLRNGQPVDFDEYSADIAAMADGLEWKRRYSFRALFGTRDLSHRELAALAGRLVENSSLMWRYRRQMYQRHFSARPFHGCLLRSVSREELSACLAMTPASDGSR
jgi:sphingomyelin phosphodiesterase acid-like 3